jgi:phosphoglycolate phosphatase-like HAD superfamily hydrolase
MKISRLKNYLFIGLFCAATMLLTTQACAPVSKAEKKNWKKERRKLTPEQLKSLVEEKENLESKLDSLREENAQLQSRISEQEQQMASLHTEFKEVSEKLKSREIELGIINEKGERWDNGVVFKVQIGAFSEYDFSQMVGSSPNMDVEENKGLKQYVVGNFRDYEEADTFKKHLRKVGVKNAWIVPYKDGRRVPLQEVLEVVID